MQYNKHNRAIGVCVIMVLITVLVFDTFGFKASAEPTLSLSINKIVGYQYGAALSGSFVVNSKVSGKVNHVDFYLNGTLEANDTEAPFAWASNTANYPVGNYNITAIAYVAFEQKTVSSINETFVEIPIIEPIIVLVVILVGVFIAVPILYVWRITRKPKQQAIPSKTHRNEDNWSGSPLVLSLNF